MQCICSPTWITIDIVDNEPKVFLCVCVWKGRSIVLIQWRHVNHIESGGNSLSWKNVIGTVPCDHDGGGRGSLTLEGNAGMCRPQDPLPFQALLQLQRPYFYFFTKKLHLISPISTDFGLISALETQIFSENLFQRPQFQAKQSVLETLLLKTCMGGTYLPKFFQVPPMWCSKEFLVNR